jgi:hypothetical protein
MNIDIQVNSDFSSYSFLGSLELRLSNVSPLTLKPFTSEDEVKSFIFNNFEKLATEKSTIIQQVVTNTPSVITVSARCMRLALLELGLLHNVVDYVKLDEKMFIEWEYATYFESSNPMIKSAADALGFLEEDVRNIFIKAENICKDEPTAVVQINEGSLDVIA